MTKKHSELTGIELHNPKGFDEAENSTVLTKDASGNLTWSGPADLSATETSAKSRLVRSLDAAATVSVIGDSILEDPAGIVARMEDTFTGATFTNFATGGYTTIDVIDNLASYVATPPDIYIVGIGFNDIRYNDARGAVSQAEYITNMTTIINSLAATGAEVYLLGIWPSFWEDQFAALYHKETNDRIKQYSNALSELCFDLGYDFVTVYEEITKNIGPFTVDQTYTDGVHPTGKGVDIYFDAIFNEKTQRVLTETIPTGDIYFKLVIEDHETAGAGGFCGIRNIGSVANQDKGLTANLAYTTENLFGPYNASAQFFNKANDWPLILLWSTDSLPPSVETTPIYSGTGVPRGIKAYALYRSRNPEALNDLNHYSWEIASEQQDPTGMAVDLYPPTRQKVFYRFIANSGDSSLNMKRIQLEAQAVRVWTQNILASSAVRFPALFDGSLTSSADGLQGNTPGYGVIFEAQFNLTSIELEAFNTLGDWTIHKSFNPECMEDFVHPSWVQVASGTGNGTAIVG